MEFEDWVIVHEVEEILGDEHESQDDLSRFEVLGFAVDDPRIDQGHNIVGNHFRVNAEIAMVTQIREDSVRNSADTKLQAGSIGDESCDVFSNSLLDGAGFGLP